MGHRLLFTLPYIFGMCGIATAIIGGSLMLTEKYSDAQWTKAAHSNRATCLDTLYRPSSYRYEGCWKALGLLDNQTLPFAIGSAVIFCICGVIFSHFWRKRFERGPVEWGMRRITG